ncbi:S1C family serine protease [Amphibacillus sp. MSJ-3]|uniref:S1C family serine protease n=1 Tax=Amphibacillus sp. MSJ-3 TaxID=2841505 RepID=UPI001C0F396C|nr:S1C family serine protease [Amphibacillus sp. MSJ-3]MBU5595280.1 S1C family serine protease [Amphibacillus sp. MSJ-3]
MSKKQKFLITLASLFILTSCLTFNYFLYKKLNQQEIEVGQQLISYDDVTKGSDNLQHLIHEAQKSIVQINVETQEITRVGSGFLYNSRGDIVTNAHVINDAIAIEVTVSNAETYPAAIVGVDKKNDIAVIRVPQLINHKPIELETSDRLLPGAEIIAVGSPLGFQNTVTIGIISGINRSFEINDYTYDNVYQISANITHGNSGGPLIDRQTGKVIGINSAGIEESDIGFSIPIPTIIDQITDWSNSISNEQLTFPTNAKELKTEPDLLLEEATYLIDYFINSLAIHDYINAYTLLGSELQNEIDYPNFRSQYLHLKDISILNYEAENITQELIEFTVSIEFDYAISQDEDNVVNYIFSVGYENDQLKILNFQPN